jgi:hypothetical protein
VAEVFADREALRDFGPMAERAVSVDAESMIRFRAGEAGLSGFVRLPFEVLAGRTVSGVPAADGPADQTVLAADFLRWLDSVDAPPATKDAHWLAPLPPRAGWRRVEVVPDSAIREVVRAGAVLARDTGSRSGQQALLEAIVLTVQSDDRQIEVPLGPLSGLTRMGFLPRGGQAAVDTAPGWIRVAAAYGSTYVSAGKPLGLLSL